MHRIWVLLAIGLMVGAAAVPLLDMNARVARLERTPRADPLQVERMHSTLDGIQGAVEKALASIAELRQEGERSAETRQRLAALEHELQGAARELELQRCKLEEWELEQPRELETLVS